MKSHEVTATERSEITLIGYGFIRSAFTNPFISFRRSMDANAFDRKASSSVSDAFRKAFIASPKRAF